MLLTHTSATVLCSSFPLPWKPLVPSGRKGWRSTLCFKQGAFRCPAILGFNAPADNLHLSTQGLWEWSVTQPPEHQLILLCFWYKPEKHWSQQLVEICSEVLCLEWSEDWDASGALSGASAGGEGSSWSESSEVTNEFSWDFPGWSLLFSDGSSSVKWCIGWNPKSATPSPLDFSSAFRAL